MKKNSRIHLIAVVVAVVLVLTAALFVSPVAKHDIVRHSPESIGRRVTVDKLRFNLITGRLYVTDLRIAGAGDSTTIFSLSDLEVRMRLSPLPAHRIEVRRGALQLPKLKIYQRGSEFNFDDIAAKFRSDTTQTALRSGTNQQAIPRNDARCADTPANRAEIGHERAGFTAQ